MAVNSLRDKFAPYYDGIRLLVIICIIVAMLVRLFSWGSERLVCFPNTAAKLIVFIVMLV